MATKDKKGFLKGLIRRIISPASSSLNDIGDSLSSANKKFLGDNKKVGAVSSALSAPHNIEDKVFNAAGKAISSFQKDKQKVAKDLVRASGGQTFISKPTYSLVSKEEKKQLNESYRKEKAATAAEVAKESSAYFKSLHKTMPARVINTTSDIPAYRVHKLRR